MIIAFFPSHILKKLVVKMTLYPKIIIFCEQSRSQADP